MPTSFATWLLPRLDKLLPFMLGGGLSYFLFAKMLQQAPKWFFFIVAAIFGVGVLSVLHLSSSQKTRKNMFLFLAVFSLPMLFIDINFGFIYDYQYTVLANGFSIGLFDIFIAIMFIGWFQDLWRGRVRMRFPTPLLVLFAFSLTINIISAAFIAREPHFAYSLLWREIKSYFYVIFLSSYLRTEEDFTILGYGFASVLLFEGLVVIEQRTLGMIFTESFLGYGTKLISIAGDGTIERQAGTMGHPNTLAAFVNSALIWVWFMAAIEKRRWHRTFLISAIILGFVASMATGSRGGWIGFTAAISVGMWLWLGKRGHNPIVGIGAILFVVGFGFALLFAVSDTFRTRLTTDDKGSAEVRKPLAQVAQAIIDDKPLFGVGAGQYVQSMRLYDRTTLRVASWYNQPVHNAFLLRTAETGYPGMVAMVGTIVTIIYYGWWVFRNSDGIWADSALTAMGALGAWSLQELSNPDCLYLSVILWVITGAMLAARNRILEAREAQREAKRRAWHAHLASARR